MHSKVNIRIVTFLAAVLLFSGAPSHAQSQSQGRLVTVTGQVFVNGQPAKAGDIVPVGAKIETENGASVSVIFGTDSVVHLSSASTVNVETVNGNAVTIALLKGAVDGVKKTGTAGEETITVKTDAATFELSAGRYVVGKNESSKSPGMSYVAVDGNATLTYAKDTSTGQKAGERVVLGDGSYTMVRPSAKTTSVVATEKKLTESQIEELRPGQKESENVAASISTITGAIVDPKVPISSPGSRDVASTESPAIGKSAGAPKDSRVDLGPPATPPGLGGGLRDPLQTLPGLANPNVTVTFEP